MIEDIGIGVAISLLVKSSPLWLSAINEAILSPAREALVDKFVEKGSDKGFKWGRKLLRLDEKEQTRHLELALRGAVERGLSNFHLPEERTQYNHVVALLADSSISGEMLRREALLLFTLDTPDLTKLNELYNRVPNSPMQGQRRTSVDATPYLTRFFESLIVELYADPFYRQQMSDVLRVRAAMSMQRSLTEIVETLRQIGLTLADNYSPDHFETDVQLYAEHTERTLRYLKLAGFVPSELGNDEREPELEGIFVPLRINSVEKQQQPRGQTQDTLVALLEQVSCLVLLGNPGSGKSTVVRYLAWSHASASLHQPTVSSISPLLSGNPLPLRIELRLLHEARNLRPEYNFLTYASDVLLGRAGITIRPQMFEILLERRAMFVLFDGLDEVATLDDRNRLVEEIESFVQRYPGNRFLVTSRPVGYNLAPLSTHLFSHAHLQPLNNEQIHLFLERWYEHVLRLSPLPSEDSHELETLFNALKDNLRLHSLAENPLLLTVITGLHRTQRLPDRRVQVYDRCAEMMLETWTKRRLHSKKHWHALKLSQEDQYDCVAHLGFVLHTRSQELRASEANERRVVKLDNSLADDVPARFVLREIEAFLQTLLPTKAERNFQARLFLDLVRDEAGLLIERGKDDDGEDLYGFIHRTFQEYFAATDIYGRYREEDDPTIISDFLRKYLHNPHWHEVILLLFGKINKSGPSTRQLRQVLEGKIRSHLSEYRDLLQADLFFVCTCLVEGVIVDNTLSEQLISLLTDLVKQTPFSSLRKNALEALIALTGTLRYADRARETLKTFLEKDIFPNISQKFDIIEAIYLSSPLNSGVRLLAIREMKRLLHEDDIPLADVLRLAWHIYPSGPDQLEDAQEVSRVISDLVQQADDPLTEAIRVADYFYGSRLKWQPFASQRLLDFARQHPTLTPQQAIELAEVLHRFGTKGQEEHLVNELLLQIVQDKSCASEQLSLAARDLYLFNPIEQSENQLAAEMLLQFARETILPVAQALQITEDIYYALSKRSEKKRLPEQMFSFLVQRPDLSVEQEVRLLQASYHASRWIPDSEQLALTQKLLQFAQQPALAVEQVVQLSNDLSLPIEKRREEQQLIRQKLLDLAQDPLLPIEQKVLVNKTVCQVLNDINSPKRDAFRQRQQAAQRLWQVAEDVSLSVAQRLSALILPLESYEGHPESSYIDKARAIHLLVSLLQEGTLPRDDAKKFLEDHWKTKSEKVAFEEAPYVADLARQELLPLIYRDHLRIILNYLISDPTESHH